MTSSAQTLEWTQENLVDSVRQQFAEDPDWLLAQRISALRRFLDAPIPVRERTPLKNRHLDHLSLFDPETTLPPGDWLKTETAGGLLVLAGSRVLEWRQPDASLNQGVIFTDLRTASRTYPEVQRHLAQVVRESNNKYEALNEAWWQNGAYLFVPRNVRIDAPFTVVHHQMAEPRGFLPRSLILLAEDSEATLIDLYVSVDPQASDQTVAAVSVEAVVEDSATLHYGSIEELSLATDAFVTRTANVSTNARTYWSIGAFGSGLEVSRQTTYLQGTGSENHSLTVFFGSGRQHHDLEVSSVHEGTHTRSSMVGKGVMQDRSRSIFTGVTDIKHGAVGSDARQKEQTLMLSDQARADAIPSLLIEENDVFAAHAASAGPIDRNMIYYLMSRGMSEATAVELIVEGFLAPVIDAIPVGDVRQRVWTAVREKVRG